MTTVTFHAKDGRLIGFTSAGHSGWGDAGGDIVCAAVTSAVRLVEATVNDVLGLSAAVRVREDVPSVSLRLPGGLEEGTEDTCQTLLTGMMVYLLQLHDEYPEAVEVLEDGEA